MGQYGTKHEPYIDLSIRKSTTTKKAGYHYCPLTAVKELFLKTSQIRQQIITIWTTIDGLLAQFITKWISYNITFNAPDPNIPLQNLAKNAQWYN